MTSETTYTPPAGTPKGRQRIESHTTVKVQYRQDDNLDRYFRVGVMSKKKHGLFSFLRIPPDAGKMELAIQLAAGAVAEDQNEKYKDNHRPEECAQAALEAYRELIKNLNNSSLTKEQLLGSGATAIL